MDIKETKDVNAQILKNEQKPRKNIEIFDKNVSIFQFYIGYCFSKELKCENFVQSKKYSLINEIIRIEKILRRQKDIKTEEKTEIKEKLKKYIEKIKNKKIRMIILIIIIL